MKAKKRLFAGMLALAMLLSLNVTAFASEPVVSVNDGPVTEVTLVKTYKLENKGTTATTGTFKYKVTPGKVENGPEGVRVAPTINGGQDYTVEFNDSSAITQDGATGHFTIDLPDFPGVGVYYYTIQEDATDDLAGVEYDTDVITMVVTVVNNKTYTGYDYYVALKEDGNKITDDEAFLNTYKAGNLVIEKDVKGLLGDTGKYFDFTIELTGEESGYQESYNISGNTEEGSNTTISVNGEEVTVGISEETGAITISNLPYGVSYEITETPDSDYTTTVNGETTNIAQGTINAVETKVTFVNTWGDADFTPDTGIYLDNLPYIIVFAGVLAAVAVLVIRRRRVDD